jgi:PAS domain S-box-containing protein
MSVDEIRLILTADGTVEDASPAALRLLGVTLEELRTAAPGTFSTEPPDPEADAAFREAWTGVGSGPIAGRATLKRKDGSLRRVRYVIAPRSDGSFAAVLEPIDERVDARSTAVVVGDVLAAWRAAERRLEEVVPDSSEWQHLQTEIRALRDRYQDLFAARRAEPG